MTIKIHLLVLMMILSSHLFAQKSKWVHTDFTIQSRALYNPSNLETGIDLSIGAEWNYSINNRFSLNLGSALNYGYYKNSVLNNEDVLFISYFKGTRIDYFNHNEVTQLSLEIPVTLQFELFQSGSNKFSLTCGTTPQFLLYSNSKGNGLDGPQTIKTSLFDGDLVFRKEAGNLDGRSHYILNDLHLNLGLNINHETVSGKVLMLGIGPQYSTYGQSMGMYVKTGFRF